MKNSKNEKQLLEAITNQNDLILTWLDDGFEMELEYDRDTKIYRMKTTGFFEFGLDFLIDIAKGLIEGIELKNET